MNTTHRRRGRRSLAAIAAALLMASVLAVVAGSPAQAANTSSEALVDTNDDGVPDAREFGGRDRYDTALRLANNFGKTKGLGSVPVAFVASGYTLVDAVSVSGLAGFLDAPVLLTQTDSLHGGVSDFIEDYGINTIYVLGGSAAIADNVLEDMEALANSPTVTRIMGDDRYATAAAIASQLGGGAAWCGGEDAAAILVNGGDVSLAEAMMVGPIAHRLQLPVLMTAADELPSATADFIEAEDIEHVVIVGGTDGVSEDVEDAVSDAGVDTVERIAGDTAAATSVELAGLLTGDCKDDLAPASGDTVALVNRDALPDGIAAAPVLSSTYDGGHLVPILVVGDTLPASVRDYLAATPESVGGNKLSLSIVAIGGTAAVSDSVMQAALAAAASADELSVAIGNGGTPDADAGTEDRTDVNGDGKYNADDAPQVGDTGVTLYFSDIIIEDSTVTDGPTPLTNAIRDILEINGAPARIANVTRQSGARAACDPSQVTVTLSNALRAGDTVSVVAGAKLGAGGDQRAVGAASITVAAPVPDRTRPTVSVVAIAGQQVAYVTITEANPGADTAATLETAEVTVRNSVGTVRTATVNNDGSVDLGAGQTFAVGDRITIAAGALTDASGNQNLQRSFTAIRAQASPRITSVLMSNLNHTAQGAAAVPASLTGGQGTPPDSNNQDRPDIWIVAKSDGAAAGALGNGWSFSFDRASTYDAAKDLDIDVRVNSRDRNVSVRFNNGRAKFADLKAALEGNSAFDALFEVKVDTDPATITGDNAGACGMPANFELAINGAGGNSATGLVRGVDASTATLANGTTKFAVQVTFNGYVMRVGDSGSEHAELAADILAATVARVQGKGTNVAGDTAVAATETVTEALTRVRGKLGWTSFQNTPDDDTDIDNIVFAMPSAMVRYMATTSDASVLPQVRDLVTTLAGQDEDTTTTPTTPAVAPVAVGYATDDDTTAAKEDENAASQVRIGQSSSVKAPS